MLIFLLVSCNGKKTFENNEQPDNYIKNVFFQRKFSWVSEIEGELLSSEKKGTINFASNLKLNPVSYGVFVANKPESLYPYIEGFASLDLSLLNVSARNVVDGFCRAFCKSEKMEQFMASRSLTELIFFRQDSSSFFTDKTEALSYIYGKPFITNDTFEVPVCFISKKGRLVVYLYLDKYSDWKIEQIQLKNWQEN